MTETRCVLCCVAGLTMAACAQGELQNVQLGGSIEIFGGWYTEFYEPGFNTPIRYPLIPAARPVGVDGTASFIRTNDTGHGYAFAEQRTRLHAAADFTDNVQAFIELDAIDDWGTDFRSANWVTGADTRANSVDDVEVYQAYIEANEMFGHPLRLRVGRQEMLFGAGWLVGVNYYPDPFTGLSFDAIRLTLGGDAFTIDAWASKLVERSPIEQDGDVDFYGVYATYAGVDDMAFDAYWMLLRDAQSYEFTRIGFAPGDWRRERLEAFLGVDQCNVTYLHTVGVRAAGERGNFDWDAEFACQFGDMDAVGAQFPTPFLPLGQVYGDDDVSWNTWAGRIEVGYTFDVRYEPRVYLGAEYYDGDDRRDMTLADWFNPFLESEASVSFNRLFSDFEMDYFLDASALSNYWGLLAGASASVTESIEVCLDVIHQEVVDPFDHPPCVQFGPWRIPVAPVLTFWDKAGAKDLGWHACLYADYAYSDDLTFEIGWSHFFVGDGVKDGSFIDGDGLSFVGGLDDADADFFWAMSTLEF